MSLSDISSECLTWPIEVSSICWARTGKISGTFSIALSGCSRKSVVGFTKYNSAHIQFISHCMESPGRFTSNIYTRNTLQYPVPQIPFCCVHSNPHLSPFSSAIPSTDQCHIFLESVSRHKAKIKVVFTSSVFLPSGITGWHCFSFNTLKIIPI